MAAQEAPVRWFVLNADANVEVDITALDSLDHLRRELTGRGIEFALARVKQELRDELNAYGLAASVGEDRISPTLPTAVAAYRSWRRDHDGDGRWGCLVDQAGCTQQRLGALPIGVTGESWSLRSAEPAQAAP